MVQVNSKLLLFHCCFLILFVSTQQGRLPHPSNAWHIRQYLDQREISPLELSGQEQRLSRYENTRVRKSREDSNNKYHLRNYQYRHRLPETEYDAEGMLFLSTPRNRQDRELNRLMNKVVDYKMNKRNGYLRHTPKSQFTKNELDRLELIVKSFEEDAERDPFEERKRTKRVNPEIYMNFADLVL